jgi:hypothetical protein
MLPPLCPTLLNPPLSFPGLNRSLVLSGLIQSPHGLIPQPPSVSQPVGHQLPQDRTTELFSYLLPLSLQKGASRRWTSCPCPTDSSPPGSDLCTRRVTENLGAQHELFPQTPDESRRGGRDNYLPRQHIAHRAMRLTKLYGRCIVPSYPRTLPKVLMVMHPLHMSVNGSVDGYNTQPCAWLVSMFVSMG